MTRLDLKTVFSPGFCLGESQGPLCWEMGALLEHQGDNYSKWSVTWSTYLIQYGEQPLYDSITMHTPILTRYVGTTKLLAIKLKTRSFDNMFFTHLNKQNAGVLSWPFKLKSLKVKSLLTIKSVGQVACLCAQTGASSWLSLRHLSFSCRNPARLKPGVNTVRHHASQDHTDHFACLHHCFYC